MKKGPRGEDPGAEVPRRGRGRWGGGGGTGRKGGGTGGRALYLIFNVG